MATAAGEPSRLERGPEILVIEDDPAILDAVAGALREEGFVVSTALRGEDGLAWAARRLPSLVILDLNLPDIDGFEVCRRLRQRSGVPILILSVRGDESDRIGGFRLGVDDYLVKPFSLAELVLRVKALLRRAAPLAGHRLQLTLPGRRGKVLLTVDTKARRAWRGHTELTLTPKEFDLLRVMMERPGQVLSRRQLADLIWESDYLGEESSIPVLICRLREKIEDDPADPEIIQTVRGVGYRLGA